MTSSLKYQTTSEKDGVIIPFNSEIKELGLSPLETGNPESVARYVRKLDQHFHLVLITDMFPESSVLLADLLDLPLWNVTNLRKKERMGSFRVSGIVVTALWLRR